MSPAPRHLVRLGDERPKPNADRLREYRARALGSLEFQLFSPAPVRAELERVRLASSLTFLAENLGGDHPIVVQVMAGKAPAARAAELVNGCTLFDPAERRRLAKEGKSGIDASQDPMIRVAALIDDQARRVRKRFEDEVEEPERQASAKIARLPFDVLGSGIAPDATFTLPLAFRVVQGHAGDGTELPYVSTARGAF